MRRFSDSAALQGALLALLAVGCGHAISIKDYSSNAGGAGNGSGVVSDNLVEELPLTGDTGGAPPVGTGACPEKTMPKDATLPGYGAIPDQQKISELMSKMSNDAKFKQMYGIDDPSDRGATAYGDIERSYDVELSGGRVIRGYNYRDAGRGVCLDAKQPNNRPTDLKDYATAFPTASTRAASWDVELEMKIGVALGDETMATKNNMMLAPCMNILRHPYWGRSQETYGEDVYHTGRMAAALTTGIQKHVVACAKHFAANNIENNRQKQNADMDEQTLREIYVPHFATVVQDAGIGCIMAAYNLLQGIKCTENKHLLRDILKGPVEANGLGFRGFVLSDWWAMEGGDAHATDTSLAQGRAQRAVEAGMDIELPWSLNYSQLANLVENQRLDSALIDEAVKRILEQKFRFNTVYTDDPWGLGTAVTRLDDREGYKASVANNEQHLELAAEAVVKSAVLLKNGANDAPVLPIADTNKPGSIAVVGLDRAITVSPATNLQPGDDGVLKFATEINTGDRGSSRVNSDPDKSIGPFDGIKAAAERHGITNVTHGNNVDAARNAEFIVAVVGLTAGDEGEEYAVKHLGDRPNLDLPDNQNGFVNELLNLGKPTVIIIESGSIVNLPWLGHSNQKQATFWAGYPGQYAGKAFGKLIFGESNFSGKMALAWPKEADMNRLVPFREGDNMTMRMGYFFGYRAYDHAAANGDAVQLEFPFGFGLSYTKFEYSNLQIPCATAKKTDVVYVKADIANTGSREGDEVMMLFVKGPPKPAGISGERPVKELKRFQRVNAIKPAGQAGSRYRVTLPVKIQDLRHWEGDAGGSWVIDSGEYEIMVGPNADNLPLKGKLTVQ